MKIDITIQGPVRIILDSKEISEQDQKVLDDLLKESARLVKRFDSLDKLTPKVQ